MFIYKWDIAEYWFNAINDGTQEVVQILLCIFVYIVFVYWFRCVTCLPNSVNQIQYYYLMVNNLKCKTLNWKCCRFNNRKSHRTHCVNGASPEHRWKTHRFTKSNPNCDHLNTSIQKKKFAFSLNYMTLQ